MGPDIDEGFRLCGYAEKKQMIISPKLVYLLLKAYKDDRDKLNVLCLNFRIVTYISMKGVWEHRLYPIIMFCQNNLEAGNSIEIWRAQFEYDAFETSVLFKNIHEYGDKFLQEDRFSIRNLQNIYRDVVREDEMENLLQILEAQEKHVASPEYDKFKNLNDKFEFHIACLCYDKFKKRFWITKHKTHGWSFGCTQITQNTDYYNIVKNAYKEKYGLDISFTEQNKLVSFYSVDRSPLKLGRILGVVVLVDNISIIEEKQDVESKWVTYEEALAITGEKKLNNFNNILSEANLILQKGKDGL